jgi:cell division inhibitor SepF
MAGSMKKIMLYLGLGPDEEYEHYDEVAEATPMRREPVSRVSASRPTGGPTSVEGTSAVRPIRGPSSPSQHQSSSVSTIIGSNELSDEGSVRPITHGGGTVRPLPRNASARPHTSSPRSFNDAQIVADKFKANTPVIMNLAGIDRDLKRRLIDFSSGICYALGGHMERVTNDVYLLTPSNVELSPEDRRRIEGHDD